MMGILEWVTWEMAKFGGGYFGVETLLGYVAATMFSEDGLNYLVWTTPNSWCSFEHVWGDDDGWCGDISCPWIGPSLFGEDLTQFIPRGWMDALLNLDLGLHWDLGLADDPNTFTKWELKDIKM